MENAQKRRWQKTSTDWQNEVTKGKVAKRGQKNKRRDEKEDKEDTKKKTQKRQSAKSVS